MVPDINSLISAAGKKLGIPEERLRRAVEDGNIAELRSYLSETDKRKLDGALKDKRVTDSIKNRYITGKKGKE